MILPRTVSVLLSCPVFCFWADTFCRRYVLSRHVLFMYRISTSIGHLLYNTQCIYKMYRHKTSQLQTYLIPLSAIFIFYLIQREDIHRKRSILQIHQTPTQEDAAIYFHFSRAHKQKIESCDKCPTGSTECGGEEGRR
jgi:hypothetical protein